MFDFTKSPAPFIWGVVIFAYILGVVVGWGITR